MILKARIQDTFIQNWNERLNDSCRARFYRTFSCFTFQPYLDILNIKKFRTALTRLRTSSHRLEIEMGRWKKPTKVPITERKCSHCQILEDEYHLLFECSLFNNIRTELIKPYFRIRPSMFKTVELIKSENKQQVKKLAMYIFKAFKSRQTSIN